MLKKLLLMLMCLAITGHSQDYLWPTNASTYLTSSFCEYRPGHYHSAIDIKTWNQEGYPCYAIADGQIYKVRVSPFGYGRVIYLRLNDGRIAVYAHLQKFNKEIEKHIQKLQLQRQRYSVTWMPKNYPLKKGQIIAYTGQTGIGVPHLHFEIRDRHERPLNPLRFYDKIKDTITPKPTDLLVIPQDEHSHVNGSFRPARFSLKRLSNGKYIVRQPIRAYGRLGLAVRGYDKANDVHNRFAFYKTSLFADSQKVFSLQYDRMDFATTNQIDVEIYYPLRARSRDVFRKMYIEPFNSLPFYDRSLGDGIISVRRDTVPVMAEVSDFSGNTVQITANILPDGVVAVQYSMVEKLNDTAFIRITLPENLSDLYFRSSHDKKNWSSVDYFEVLERRQSLQGQELLLSLRLKNTQDDFLAIRGRTTDNEQIRTVVRLNGSNPGDFDLNIHNMGKYLLLESYPVQAMPGFNVVLRQGLRRKSYPPRIINNRMELVIPARDLTNDSLQISIIAGGKSLLDTLVIFQKFIPGERRTYSLEGGLGQVTSFAASPFDTLLFSTTRTSTSDSTYLSQIYSDVLGLDWNGQILNRSILLKLRPDSLAAFARQMGIYHLSNAGLNYVGAVIDSINGTVSASVKSAGRYVVARDNEPPRVEITYPGPGAKLNRMSRIQFELEDTLSGIGSDANIEVRVDGNFVIPEWDPERGLVTGHPHWKLKKGEHIIKVAVKDQAGNVTVLERKVTIFKE